MTSRAWVYNMVTGETAITSLVSTRISSVTALQGVPAKPFIMIRMTAHTPALSGDDRTQQVSEVATFYVHDTVGSYDRIDTLVEALIALFDGVVDQANGITSSRWIETSDDWRDDEMGTVMKYVRIQIVRS